MIYHAAVHYANHVSVSAVRVCVTHTRWMADVCSRGEDVPVLMLIATSAECSPQNCDVCRTFFFFFLALTFQKFSNLVPALACVTNDQLGDVRSDTDRKCCAGNLPDVHAYLCALGRIFCHILEKI